ncbi:hypothetical protein [Halocatena pleomorpha]|uniref:Uncharacterized protein n=1 Tax=Halocatena pleomorpha TaxID=1785090 RepID=A0A3P3R942_9EURY|nr:hypothetical protein [Halocatena pleomorpha]RRJ29170.1 hypothetical protein EIK79_13610 [Halocatena pleomorpha]
MTTSTGCLDGLLRSASDSRTLSISGTESGETASDFRAYVGRIHDRYGPHGVWGVQNTESDHPFDTAKLTYVGAWSDQWVLGTAADKKGIHVSIDVAGVLYRVRPSQQSATRGERYRLWLWTGATPTQPDDGVSNTTLTTLSVGIDIDGGVLDSYRPTTSVGPDDTPIRIGFDDPLFPRTRRRLPAGRIQPDPDETNTGNNGAFVLNWSGGYGDTISVAGACELHQRKKKFEFTVTSEASASQGTL